MLDKPRAWITHVPHAAWYGTRVEAQALANEHQCEVIDICGAIVSPSTETDRATRTLRGVRARVRPFAGRTPIRVTGVDGGFACECVDTDAVSAACAWSPEDGDRIMLGVGIDPDSADGGFTCHLTRDQARALARTLLRFADAKSDA